MEAPSRTAFEKGRAYARREIREALGGSARAALPTRGGRVTCVCARRRMNPRAPAQILLPGGVRAAPAARALAGAGGPVPVFVGERARQWTYAGLWEVERLVEDPGEAAALAAASGVTGAVMALLLRECPDAATPADGVAGAKEATPWRR